ncbi:MAG: mycofactocin system FadH/OYE family oxidoreductase 2, partial [Ilumatobacteraceae bacterium]
ACSPPGLLKSQRAEFGDLIRNQLAECKRLGVTIQFNVAVGVELVEELRPDHVIVATGSEPQRPWWVPEQHTGTRFCDVREVLEGTVTPSGKVIVVDEVGFHHATSVGELLADRGCSVEVITSAMVVGQDLGQTLDMENWWMRARAKGIVQSTDLVPIAMSGSELTLLHHPTGTNLTRNIDWVVLAAPGRPVEKLYHQLKSRGFSVSRIGDCVAPRRAHAAVIEGDRVGASL